MKKTKKIIKILLVIIGTLLLAVFIAWKFDLQSPRESNLKKQGSDIVLKVESFKSQNGRLPINLREMGLPESEEGPIFYDKKKDGINYTVSFSGSTLGESTYYDSEDKMWHDF